MSNLPICTAPWTSLIINGANYNCCCYFGMKREPFPFPTSKKSVMDIFNSQSYQEIRRRILNRDIDGTACETCLERLGTKALTEQYPGRSPISSRHDAYQSAMRSAANGEIVVHHAPISYSLNTCTDCNLRCVMCYNSKLPEDGIKGNLVPYKKFIAMLDDIGLDNITSICAVGGETFMTPDALAIIDYLSWHQESGVTFSTNTNGALLHKHRDLLQRFQRIAIQFSIEGFEHTYESIRRGASWKRLLQNLEWCVEVARQRPGWNLSVNSLIMKTSIPDMKRVINLLQDKVNYIRFTPVMGDYHDENIFQFPELLQGMDWQRHFDEAIETATAGFPDAVRHLRVAKRELEEVATTKQSLMIYNGTPDLFISMLRHIETSCPDQQVIIAGTRGNLADFLSWCHGRTSKQFTVASFDIIDISRAYAGWPMTTMDALPKGSGMVMLGCQTFEFAKYGAYLQKNYPHMMLETLPYWTEETHVAVSRLVERLEGRPVVLYAAGGTAEVLLSTTEIATLDVRAFSDGNPQKHETRFLGKPVIHPEQILHYALDVVICSDFYTHRIAQDLEELYGDGLRIHCIF